MATQISGASAPGRKTCRNKVALFCPIVLMIRHGKISFWREHVWRKTGRNKVALFSSLGPIRHGNTDFRRKRTWKENLP